MLYIKISRQFNLSNYEVTKSFDKDFNTVEEMILLSKELDNVINHEKLSIRKAEVLEQMINAIKEAKEIGKYNEQDFSINFIYKASSIEELESEFAKACGRIFHKHSINVGYAF